MKNKLTALSFFAIIAMISIGPLVSYPTGADPGYTSAPGESNCTGCHAGSANPANGGSAAISITGNPASYVAGQTYEINITVNYTGRSKFGFALSAKKPAGTVVGSLSTNGNTAVKSGGTYMTHSTNGTLGSTNSKTWKFNWTAPSTSAGTVTFYASGLAANANGFSDGDYVYTTNLAFPALSSGVNELDNDRSLTVYPNPVKESLQLQLNLNEAADAAISLIDLSGREVQSFGKLAFNKGLNEQTLAINNQGLKGIYLLRLELNEKVVYKKILVD